MERLTTLWSQERPAAALWTPVFLGLGIQIYFWLPTEPAGWLLTFLAAIPMLAWTVFWPQLRRYRLLGFAVFLIAIGIALAGGRARVVEAPVLSGQLEATVEGVVRDVTRTRSGRPRVVLDNLIVFGLAEDETPKRVQIALLRDRDIQGIAPGTSISIFAHLGPPGGPVEPGGFDFRRTAWFQSLGGVGYARGSPVVIENTGTPPLMRRLSIGLAHLRGEISAGLRARLPGETGAFAAAVTVGDRAGVSPESMDALRRSNLAHLLAISGLHMGLVTAIVFGAARLLLSITPVISRTWRTKRLAAIIALGAAIGYLALSGASIATQRAFIMAAVALVAVILNRPAITMRALSVAALIILVYRPESLMHVGFQMSFAATAAIISGFDFAREREWTLRVEDAGPVGKLASYGIALLATSVLAGAATAPFSAFHFNQMSHYGLLGNLAAVPIMGFIVAPAALVAVVLSPLGLEMCGLVVMGAGIDAIMDIARFVSGLDGSTRLIPAAAPIVLTLIAAGGLGLVLGRSLLRGAGGLLLGAGLIVWFVGQPRPEMLVAPSGRLVGIMTENGRALDHHSSASYAAQIWLRKDGDAAVQEKAAARGAFTGGYNGSVAELSNGWKVSNVLARRPLQARLDELCQNKMVLIAANASTRPDGPCMFYGKEEMTIAGALAISVAGNEVAIQTSAEKAGVRFWTDASRYDEREAVGVK